MFLLFHGRILFLVVVVIDVGVVVFIVDCCCCCFGCCSDSIFVVVRQNVPLTFSVFSEHFVFVLVDSWCLRVDSLLPL